MFKNNRIFYWIPAGIAILLSLALTLAGCVGINGPAKVEPSPSAQPALVPSIAAVATPTAGPACGGPEAMFILLIGSDTRADNYAAGLADSMRIVRVDFMHPGMQILTFQRDLYVEIPGISAHGGITHGKLNQAYLYGNPAFGYYNGSGQGPGLLAATLHQNFGTRVDHYVALNTATFVRILDTLGGIDINLPHALDGRVERSRDPNRVFPAGEQHLDGYRTMLLARLRPNGDLERSDMQNLILQALAAKILAPENLAQMPRLIEAFYGSVQTDLSAEDMARLLCLGALLGNQSIVPVDFPPELFTASRVQDPVLGYTFIWDVDFNLLRAYVDNFNRGTWPQTPLATP